MDDCVNCEFLEKCREGEKVPCPWEKADGKPYKYGHGWVIDNIPEKDLEEIKNLFAE